MRLDESLDPKIRAYLEGVIVEAGEILYTTRLYYDMDERRRFERAAERLKKELRESDNSPRPGRGMILKNIPEKQSSFGQK
jgi:hypothetical protein